MRASRRGDLEVVQSLVSAGTQILKTAQETLQTAMLTSAAAPLLEVVASFMPILSVLYARLCCSCLALQHNYWQGKQIDM